MYMNKSHLDIQNRVVLINAKCVTEIKEVAPKEDKIKRREKKGYYFDFLVFITLSDKYLIIENVLF